MATERQVNKAAKLWGFSQIAQYGDELLTNTSPDIAALSLTVTIWATKELAKLGFSPFELNSVQDCLKAAMKESYNDK